MLNISMKITSKLKIEKVNPLKRKIVKILFIHSKTCNIYLKDNFGKSAIDYALINRNQKIRQLFEPYYAKRIPQGIEHFPCNKNNQMSVVKRKWNASEENDAATAIDPCIQDCNAANWNATGHLQLPVTSNHIQRVVV